MSDRETESGAQPTPTVAASSALLLLSSLSSNLGYFAAVLFLARWLGPEGRGTVAFATLSVLMLSRLTGLGVPEAASVQTAAHPELRAVLLTNQIGFTMLTSSLVAAGYVGLLVATGAHPAGVTTSTLLVVAAGIVLYSLIDGIYRFLIACGRVRIVAAIALIQPWGWAVGIGIARHAGHLYAGSAVIAWTAPFLLVLPVLLTVAIRHSGIAPPNRRTLVDAIRFGFPAWVGGMSTVVNYRLDQVLMGFISTRSQLGLYAVAVNASEVLLYVSNSTGLALTPTIARGDAASASDRALRAFRGAAMLTIAATIAAVAAGPFLVPLVFGARYRGSIAPFVVLAIGAVGWATSTVLSSALLGVRASRLSSVGSISALVVAVILDITLIPPFGALGAAAATAVGFFAAGAAATIAFIRRFEVAPRDLVPRREDLQPLSRLVRTFAPRSRRKKR